jgi:hypothetical protein
VGALCQVARVTGAGECRDARHRAGMTSDGQDEARLPPTIVVRQPRTNWQAQIKVLLDDVVDRVLKPALANARKNDNTDTIHSRNVGHIHLGMTYAEDLPYLCYLAAKLDQIDDPQFTEALFHALNLVRETMAYGYVPFSAVHRIDAAAGARARQGKAAKTKERDDFITDVLPKLTGPTPCRLKTLNEQLKAAKLPPIGKSTLYKKFPTLLELERK